MTSHAEVIGSEISEPRPQCKPPTMSGLSGVTVDPATMHRVPAIEGGFGHSLSTSQKLALLIELERIT